MATCAGIEISSRGIATSPVLRDLDPRASPMSKLIGLSQLGSSSGVNAFAIGSCCLEVSGWRYGRRCFQGAGRPACSDDARPPRRAGDQGRVAGHRRGHAWVGSPIVGTEDPRASSISCLQPNKQSIVLDLKSDDGETTLTSRHRMAQESGCGRTGPWRPVCQCRRRFVDLAGVQAVVQHADVAIGPLREAAVWLSPHWRWWS